jgi:hypothetical protein
MNATYLLSLLPLLACPLAMGGMMWLMMRMNKNRSGEATPPSAGAVAPGDRLEALRAQLGEVEAQQAALAGHVAALGEGDRAVAATQRP